jgi:hypothetical protein
LRRKGILGWLVDGFVGTNPKPRQLLDTILPQYMSCEIVKPPPQNSAKCGFIHNNSVDVLLSLFSFNKLFNFFATLELHNIGGVLREDINNFAAKHLSFLLFNVNSL